MKYVLDTNTLIYFFKGIGNVADHLLSTPPDDIGIPAIVVFELAAGIRKSNFPQKRTAQLKEFLDIVRVIPFSLEEAQAAARIRVELEKKGLSIGPYDVLIAATALAADATLITRNIKEFQRIDPLRIQDWFS
jgi:tRNA(fMet)-specific endonuclease VapC